MLPKYTHKYKMLLKQKCASQEQQYNSTATAVQYQSTGQHKMNNKCLQNDTALLHHTSQYNRKLLRSTTKIRHTNNAIHLKY